MSSDFYYFFYIFLCVKNPPVRRLKNGFFRPKSVLSQISLNKNSELKA